MKKDKKQQDMFNDIVRQYGDVVRRVCFMYSDGSGNFDDLYQETMVNIWRGMDSFRGDSQMSTWIYRTAVNTCISWLRMNRRHSGHSDINEALTIVAGDDTEHRENLRQMYNVISRLDPLEKAVIMMWLDSEPYERIAEVTGLSYRNVATRLHRIKLKIKNICESES